MTISSECHNSNDSRSQYRDEVIKLLHDRKKKGPLSEQELIEIQSIIEDLTMKYDDKNIYSTAPNLIKRLIRKDKPSAKDYLKSRLQDKDDLEMLFYLALETIILHVLEPWQLGSQDGATPMMQGIIDLHHDIFFFLILILVFVLRILVRALWHFHYKKNPIPQRIVHGTTIEILRTIFPSIIPMFIAIPSFALLYSMDEVVVDPAITIKAIGHQWYRTYEYSDYNSSDEQSLTFDSYTIPEDDLELGQSRLLEVDNRVVVPAKTHLRILVTSADVLHSWAVPSLGVKCDAVPGRLNQISISVQREGVYYGQCSEICGTNHAFMPIVIESVAKKDYASRVANQLSEPWANTLFTIYESEAL
uniref:Cytochrome c oxidase subunit 2 n=1 Tax=Garcinia humilis TaxID=2867533 RepID=A0AAU7GGA5_9ROSI